MPDEEELRFRGGARMSLVVVPPPLAQIRVTVDSIELRCLGVFREQIARGLGDYIEIDDKYLPVGLRLVHVGLGHKGGVFIASGDAVVREVQRLGWPVSPRR